MDNRILESRLPADGRDPQYGIPQLQKYPLYDEKHVKSAIRLFGHVEPRYEEQLAKAIIMKMRKYDISFKMVGQDNKLYKYIPEKLLQESADIPMTQVIRVDNELSNFDIKNYSDAESLGTALGKYHTKKEDMLKNKDMYPDSAFKHIEKIIDELNSEMKKYDCECKKVNEDVETISDETKILNNLRADIQDELTAIKNYDTHADEAEAAGYGDVAKVLRDIRDEEKVHIGELQTVLSKHDEEYQKSLDDGKKEVEEELNESVLDPVQKTRCEDIFTPDNKVKPEVKEFIISTFEKFLSELDDVNLKVKQYLLIGSSTSYQYTDTSDVDVTVLAEEYPEDVRRKIVPLLPNGNNLPGTQRPVNYFIREEMDNRLAENIYDLTNDTWIKEMPRENVEVPQSYILEIAKFFMNAVDLTVSEFERDKQAYLEYKDLDPERVEISPEERTNVMNSKMAEIKADLDSIRIGNHMIRGFLHDAYDSEENYFKVNIEIGNPYGTPHRSVNNLVYKCLEKYGYREKIDNFIKDAKEFIKNEENDK